jgi:probable HAF family extracellular repeat protein
MTNPNLVSCFGVVSLLAFCSGCAITRNVEAYKAQTDFAEGKYESSLGSASKVEGHAGTKPAVLAQMGFLRGLCYDGLDQPGEAKASFKSVVDRYPDTDGGFMAKQMLDLEPVNLGPPVKPSATGRDLNAVLGIPERPYVYFVEAAAISGDGNVMIGEQVISPHFILSSAPTIVNLFRWTKTDGPRRIGVITVPVNMKYNGILSQTLKISNDGSVIAGALAGTNSTPAQPDAFLWTQTGGMQDLGEKSNYRWTDAAALSADGSVLVGEYMTGAGTGTNTRTGFFRWTRRGGFEDLGNLGAPVDRTTLWVDAVSNDGAVVTGRLIVRGAAGFHMFRWTQTGGFQDLGTFGGQSANLLSTSPDGSALVAATGMPDKSKRIVRWTQSGGPRDLGVISDPSAWATCASEDGSVVIGTAGIPKSNLRNSVPFRWTPSSGLQYVCELGPAWDTKPVGVTRDGSRILLNVHYLMACQQGGVVIPVDSMSIPVSQPATAWVFYKSFVCRFDPVPR